MGVIRLVTAMMFYFIAAVNPLPAAETAARTLQQTLTALNAVFYWDSLFQSGMISVNGHNVVFNTGQHGQRDYALYDNSRLLDLPVPWINKGVLYFPEEFIVSVRSIFENSALNETFNFKIAAIMIDPGHGGKDTGATSNHVIKGKKINVVEKDIALAVSKDLYSKLKTAFPGKKILISRTGDTYPSLSDRIAMANSVPLRDNEAIIYISIHANASFNKRARGFEVWFLDPRHDRMVIDKNTAKEYKEIAPILNDILQEEFNRESGQLAAFIYQEMKESFGSSLPARGMKAEDFFVVRKALMPSVLVELAFVTNPDDAVLLTNAASLKKFSDSIYKGIMDFVTMFEKMSGGVSSQ
jgi:N-acetylmuramoyl-L-alanine amidase